MPANQPVHDIEALEDPLVKAYAQAWERVTRLQQAIVDDPKTWRRQAKLANARQVIEDSMDELDVATSAWLKGDFPKVYAMGAAAGSVDAGGPASMVWNQVSTNAVQNMAQDLFNDLLASTKNVRDSTKQMVRSVMKDEALSKAIIGDTAKSAGKQAQKLLESKGIKAITYRDGSSHGLAEYSQMAIRTKTATAYNVGTLAGAENLGVKYWEVFDGPFCGWSSHDDGQALGMVVSQQEAMSFPIAHPNCRRAFGARPDITTKQQAKDETKKGGSTSTGQKQAQIAQDDTRLENQRVARNQQSRLDRRQKRLESKGSSRQAKQDALRVRRGELDMQPPSKALADLIPGLPADAYAGLKTVADLIHEGWTPADAAKEVKRLKANAASKLSKQKAKLKAAGTHDVLAKAPATAAGNLQVFKTADEWRAMTVDTTNVIPCKGLKMYQGQYTMKEGIATRRNGISYVMETKAGEVIGPMQLAKLEDHIATVEKALVGQGKLRGTTERVVITEGRNPDDAYWAKKYKSPGFKSAACAGRGEITVWGSKYVNAGTISHEAGHNADRVISFGLKGPTGGLSETPRFSNAIAADAKTSSRFTGGKSWSPQFSEGSGLTSGQHPLIMGEEHVSSYAATNAKENWAESYRLYLRDQRDGRIGTYRAVDANGTMVPLGEAVTVRFVDAFPERAKIFDELTGNTPIAPSKFKETVVVKGQPSLNNTVTHPAHGTQITIDGKAAGWLHKVSDVYGGFYEVRDLTGEVITGLEGVTQKEALIAFKYHLIGKADQAVAAGAKKIGTTATKQIWSGAEPAGWPGHDAARKSLPKNVQASVASAKSNAKKLYLNQGHSLAEATEYAASVEREQVLKRWQALRGAGGMTKGFVAADKKALIALEKAAADAHTQKVLEELIAKNKAKGEAIAAEKAAKAARIAEHKAIQIARLKAERLAGRGEGLTSAEQLDGDVQAGKDFIARANSDASAAKAKVSRDLSARLNNEADWNTFREYKGSMDAIQDSRGLVKGVGLLDSNVEKLLKYFDEYKYQSSLFSDSPAYDPRDAVKILQKLNLPVNDVAKYQRIAWYHKMGTLRGGYSKAGGHPSGLPSFAESTAVERTEILNKEISARISQWATSSGDSHIPSVMMQQAIKDEFGLVGDVAVRTSSSVAQAVAEDYKKAGSWYRRFVRAQYENTQQAFIDEEVTHVWVHRGMGFSGAGPAWAQEGVQSATKFQPANSWSVSQKTAQRFASGMEGTTSVDLRVVFSARVPVSQILGTPRTGFGCLNETEYVIMNGPGEVVVNQAWRSSY